MTNLVSFNPNEDSNPSGVGVNLSLAPLSLFPAPWDPFQGLESLLGFCVFVQVLREGQMLGIRVHGVRSWG